MKKTVSSILILFLCLFSLSITAQEKKSLFRHASDDKFDASNFLNSTVGFLPVPIIITEPAVGYGGGLVLAYFHKKKDGDKRPLGLSPTITFGGGAYTENGTWAAFLGHQGSYNKDNIRYLGFLGFVSPNLTFYGPGLGGITDKKYEFNMEGFVTLQEVLFRVKKEIPLFAGLNYTYFNNNISFKTGIDVPGLDVFQGEITNTGMHAVVEYDGRDNTLTPIKGIKSVIEVGKFAEFLGGDQDYWDLNFRTYGYVPVLKNKLFSSYRMQIQSTTDETPFYALPFISLRGIPALRYQGNNVLTLETEWRWNVYKRWSLVGFVGAGDAMENFSEFGQNIKAAGGGGFRYFLAKDYGLHAGIDIAKGPEQWAWKFTIGSNWGR